MVRLAHAAPNVQRLGGGEGWLLLILKLHGDHAGFRGITAGLRDWGSGFGRFGIWGHNPSNEESNGKENGQSNRSCGCTGAS